MKNIKLYFIYYYYYYYYYLGGCTMFPSSCAHFAIMLSSSSNYLLYTQYILSKVVVFRLQIFVTE
jgi:hypothetical protein